MSDVTEASPKVIYVLDRSVGSKIDCGSSASAQNETSAVLLLPASPSHLGSRGFWQAGRVDRR